MIIAGHAQVERVADVCAEFEVVIPVDFADVVNELILTFQLSSGQLQCVLFPRA